jgi:hypothetical protein
VVVADPTSAVQLPEAEAVAAGHLLLQIINS